MTKSIIASVLVVFLLSACASLAQFQQFMDRYIGQPIASVQDAFGYNFTERTLDDGRKAYTWQWSRQGATPGYRMPTTVYASRWNRYDRYYLSYPPTYYEEHCEFTFITDTQGRVNAWRAQGDGCASYRPEAVLRSAP